MGKHSKKPKIRTAKRRTLMKSRSLTEILNDAIDKDLEEYREELKEFKTCWESHYEISKEELQKILDVANLLLKIAGEKTKRGAKPAVPFSNATEKEREFMRSMTAPKNYYHFQAFGVKICVHYMKGYSSQKRNLEKGDWYFLGVTGWIPQGNDWSGQKWQCFSPHITGNVMSFWQATKDFDIAVANFYVAVKRFLQECGVGYGEQLFFELSESKKNVL